MGGRERKNKKLILARRIPEINGFGGISVDGVQLQTERRNRNQPPVADTDTYRHLLPAMNRLFGELRLQTQRS